MARALRVLAVALLLLAVVALATGGVRLAVGAFRLSATNAGRLVFQAALCWLAATLLAPSDEDQPARRGMLAAIVAVLLGAAADSHPQRVGDGAEYVAMALNLSTLVLRLSRRRTSPPRTRSSIPRPASSGCACRRAFWVWTDVRTRITSGSTRWLPRPVSRLRGPRGFTSTTRSRSSTACSSPAWPGCSSGVDTRLPPPSSLAGLPVVARQGTCGGLPVRHHRGGHARRGVAAVAGAPWCRPRERSKPCWTRSARRHRGLRGRSSALASWHGGPSRGASRRVRVEEDGGHGPCARHRIDRARLLPLAPRHVVAARGGGRRYGSRATGSC